MDESAIEQDLQIWFSYSGKPAWRRASRHCPKPGLTQADPWNNAELLTRLDENEPSRAIVIVGVGGVHRAK